MSNRVEATSTTQTKQSVKLFKAYRHEKKFSKVILRILKRISYILVVMIIALYEMNRSYIEIQASINKRPKEGLFLRVFDVGTIAMLGISRWIMWSSIAIGLWMLMLVVLSRASNQWRLWKKGRKE